MERIIKRSLNISVEESWEFDRIPAIARLTISSPAVIRPFEKFNKEKKYSNQIKPLNLLLTCHVSPFGHPLSTDPEEFHLVAPYELNPKKWLKTGTQKGHSSSR